MSNPSWYQKINTALIPILGPADLGTRGAEERERVAEDRTCPKCEQRMSAHAVEHREDGHSALYCPAA